MTPDELAMIKDHAERLFVPSVINFFTGEQLSPGHSGCSQVEVAALIAEVERLQIDLCLAAATVTVLAELVRRKEGIDQKEEEALQRDIERWGRLGNCS